MLLKNPRCLQESAANPGSEPMCLTDLVQPALCGELPSTETTPPSLHCSMGAASSSGWSMAWGGPESWQAAAGSGLGAVGAACGLLVTCRLGPGFAGGVSWGL